MAKELRCGDLMPGCSNFVAQGKGENEVMQKAGEHAKRDHGMAAIPPEVERKARGTIRESGGARKTG